MYLRFGVYTSNAIGYIVGIIISFILNTLFTFSTKLTWIRFIKFIINCGVCYIINLTIIYLVLFINNEWIYFAQLCGMGAYTVSGFIFNKFMGNEIMTTVTEQSRTAIIGDRCSLLQ